MTAMDKERELRQRWQRVAKLILAKENVLTVSRALELALFMDAKLDLRQPENQGDIRHGTSIPTSTAAVR